MKDEEKSEISTKCRQLKLKSSKDGKRYTTDTLDTEGILRLIESVPSKKAEPFKLWLASIISKENNLNFKYLDDNKLLENGDKSSGKNPVKRKV